MTDNDITAGQVTADSIATDTITSDANSMYTRISVPDVSSDAASGSYLRVGDYVADEADYIPGDYTGNKSIADASGLFLKTSGKLFCSVDSSSYQYFKDVLSVHAGSEMTLTSDGPQSIKGTTLTGTSTEGKVTISAATSVDITANSGTITNTAKGNHSTKIFGDKWAECKGTWKSLSYGRTYSAFVGSNLQFNVGDVVSFFGGLCMTNVLLFVRFTVGMELVCFGWYRLVFGMMDVKVLSTKVLAVKAEIKNRALTLHSDTWHLRQADFAAGNQGVNVQGANVNLTRDMTAVRNSVIRIYM